MKFLLLFLILASCASHQGEKVDNTEQEENFHRYNRETRGTIR